MYNADDRSTAVRNQSRTADFGGENGLRHHRALHWRQGQRLRRRVSCGLHPSAQGRAGVRVGEDAQQPSRRMHRLRGVRAGVSGRGHLRARRGPREVQGLHLAERDVLQEIACRPPHGEDPVASPYLDFDRAAWARLRAATPLTLGEDDLAELQGLNERVSIAEVEAIYLPVSRLLNLHVAATQTLHKAADTFLGRLPSPTPYVIGVAGSVAVGKSTFARILRALLSRWPAHPRVDLVTTDGFLLPNHVLEDRRLMGRKGFPESYDLRRLVQFMIDVKAGGGAV